jgi:acyl carrier protein
MTDNEMLLKLRHVMKQSSPEKVDWDSVDMASTIESLGFDSLTILDLVYDIQQEFGIEFEAEGLATVKTVGDLINFLKSKM